ncbi:MAG TPA: ATP-dependent endonuclease, partial [Vibrio sp.]|nr:ATP-dependent endonuclease [Vibrio sp.]
MLLERIEIAGFRGIKRLSISFDQLTALIGENTWGKSSLLDTLSVALPPDGVPYQFELTDFHLDHSISHPQTQHLQIVLTLLAHDTREVQSRRYRKIKPVWVSDSEDAHRIYYRISASREQYDIQTHYDFLNRDGDPIALHHTQKIAQELMSLHPVIRLKDSRRFERTAESNGSFNERIEKRINNTCRRLMAIPGHVNKGEMRSSLKSMGMLVEHYFSFKSNTRMVHNQPRDGIFYTTKSDSISINDYVEQSNNKQTRLLLLGLLNAYLQAKGPNRLRRGARPILI